MSYARRPAGRTSILYLIVGANSMSALVRFMALPFLALYLHVAVHASFAMSGLVVGIGSLSTVVASLVLGPLSDHMSRVRVMLAGTALLGLCFMGEGFASTVGLFIVLQVLVGIGFALEGPAFSALISDLTPPEERVPVFGWVYWGANVGAAFGPALGSLAGAGHHGLPFVLAGAVVLLLAAAGFVGLRRLPEHHVPEGLRPPLRDSLRALAAPLGDRVLLLYLVGQLVSGLAYVQLETTLGQYVGTHTAMGARLFGFMMASNGLTVIALQPLASRWLQTRSVVWSTIVGTGIMAVASLGYGVVRAPAAWIGNHVFLTVGEVVSAPVQQTVVSVLAPPNRRATYFTLQNLAFGFSQFAGPALGGLLLQTVGKWAVFGGMAFFNGAALWFYWSGLKNDVRFRRAARDLSDAAVSP
jgi:MFS family permease